MVASVPELTKRTRSTDGLSSPVRPPAARRMKIGEAPTALKARTGLSTPPGRICCARANSVRDFETLIDGGTCLSRSHEGHEGTRRTPKNYVVFVFFVSL